MSDSTSGKRTGREIRQANLQPIQPGEVRNPEGVNQYTYKRDFEQTVDALLKGQLSPDEAESIPDWVRGLVSPNMTRGEALGLIAVQGALRGEGRHFDELLKRLWPSTEKREHQLAVGPPQPIEFKPDPGRPLRIARILQELDLDGANEKPG